jgi:hypothetical protein
MLTCHEAATERRVMPRANYTHAGRVTGYIIRVTQRVPLVE